MFRLKWQLSSFTSSLGVAKNTELISVSVKNYFQWAHLCQRNHIKKNTCPQAFRVNLASDLQPSALLAPKTNRQDEQIKKKKELNEKRGTVEATFSDFKSNLKGIFWPLPPSADLCAGRTRL